MIKDRLTEILLFMLIVLFGFVLFIAIQNKVLNHKINKYQDEVLSLKLDLNEQAIERLERVIKESKDSAKVIKEIIYVRDKKLKKQIEKIKNETNIDSSIVNYTNAKRRLFDARKSISKIRN